MLVFRASYALVYARGSECWGGLRSFLLLLFSLFYFILFSSGRKEGCGKFENSRLFER